MKIESVHIIDGSTVARVTSYVEPERLANLRVTLLQDSFAVGGVPYPMQSITFDGDGLAALRDLLNGFPKK